MDSEPENLRFFKIKIKDLDTFKGLIISDFHLGKFNDLLVEENLLINDLKQLVKEVNPTHIFILGDIINFTESCVDEWYFNFFKMLENNFNLPIYIIPGNHDRLSKPSCCFSRYKSDKLLKCIDTEFLEIQFNDNFSVFFVHDAKYDSNIYGMLPLKDWMNKIRSWDHGKNIKKDDVLIFGHTHSNFDDDEDKNYAIGPFSVSLKGTSYGVIFYNDKFHFQHFTSFLPEKA